MTMNRNNFYCVIMAGGSGTRFWPMSRLSRPKQFLDMADSGKTFIRQTYERFLKIVPQENILIVSSKRHEDIVKKEIPEISEENLLLEPYSRNTAPCVAYATYTLLKRNPNALMVVTPSDHIIENEEMFVDNISKAFEHVSKNDVLMTFGVIPTRPDTNFGYIQACGGRGVYEKKEPMPVKTFTEKPSQELAKVFIETGEFFWNSGIFIWKAEVIKEELEKHLPEITSPFRGWENAIGSKIENDFVARAFTDCQNISLDRALMEKTERAWIYPVEFWWAEIGTWETLYKIMPKKDTMGNVYNIDKALLKHDKDTLIISNNKEKLIAVKGLENFMVIDTEDVLVICPKNDSQFKDFISGIAMPEYEKYR